MVHVGVINYGAGNIASVMNALDYAGADADLVSDPNALSSYDKLILPGVGASGQAIDKLNASGMAEALNDHVRIQGKPFLGICVGMHLLATDMYEFGNHKGLGWINGRVISLKDHGVKNRPIPHMGWSDTSFSGPLSDISRQLGRHKAFYYAHSYTLVSDDKSIIHSQVKYNNIDITAGIAFDNICAFQFHPEKSQVSGDILMQWFVDWNP